LTFNKTGFWQTVSAHIMNCNYFLPFFLFFDSFLLQSLIFRNLIFHKKKKYKLYFQFEAKTKMKERINGKNILTAFTVCPKTLYENHRIWKKVATFQIWKRKIFVSKKKFCNQNLKKKIKILFSGSGLHYWITKNTQQSRIWISVGHIFSPVFVFVKTKKFPFQMSKYKKKKRKNSHAYISEKKKKKWKIKKLLLLLLL